jgi:hypothetical protein
LVGRFGVFAVIKPMASTQPVNTTIAPALTQREQLLAAAIAEQVATLLHDNKPRVRIVDAATLAAELGVSRDFVYAHASELGGQRLGGGPRGRLRFDLAQALAAWASRPPRAQPSGSPTPIRPRRRKQPGNDAKLLPIRGGATATDGHDGRP